MISEFLFGFNGVTICEVLKIDFYLECLYCYEIYYIDENLLIGGKDLVIWF